MIGKVLIYQIGVELQLEKEEKAKKVLKRMIEHIEREKEKISCLTKQYETSLEQSIDELARIFDGGGYN